MYANYLYINRSPIPHSFALFCKEICDSEISVISELANFFRSIVSPDSISPYKLWQKWVWINPYQTEWASHFEFWFKKECLD